MATLLFVHGISIRQEAYDAAFQQIQGWLTRRAPEIVLAPCVWGDTYGAALKAAGASIPLYSVSKGLEPAPAPDAMLMEDEIGRWQALYSDPLAELRLASLRPAESEPFDPLGRKTANQLLDERLQSLAPTTDLAATLARSGINPGEFHAARQAIVASQPYHDALNSCSPDQLGDFSWAAARAIVARMISPVNSDGLWEANLLDADTRDTLVAQLAAELGGQTKGLVGSLLPRAAGLLGTHYITSTRGLFLGATVPYIGDILLYQGSGQPIRDLIRRHIEQCEPPVVVLGHSLGGIACVELLAAQPLPAVDMLVTVGSQAPFFYEMGALTSLPFGQGLPAHFPRWLNIYDRHDFLSFIGGRVFAGHDVEDVEVDNRQPFPWSHSAYWRNSQTWDAILARFRR